MLKGSESIKYTVNLLNIGNIVVNLWLQWGDALRQTLKLMIMKRVILAIALSFAAAAAMAQDEEPMPGMILETPIEIYPPRITMPTQSDDVAGAPHLDFANPVTFAWFPCTSNSIEEPYTLTYDIYFYRLNGTSPYMALSGVPVYEEHNLTAPQFTYSASLPERIGTFINNEAYAFIVKANAIGMGIPICLENDGYSAHSVFIVKDPQQVPDGNPSKAPAK